MSTKCEVCECIYTKKKHFKVRYHEWDAKVVRDDVAKQVIKCNYIGALCSTCNINITMKLNKLPVFAHNATRYDNHFVLSDITDEFHELAMISKSWFYVTIY